MGTGMFFQNVAQQGCCARAYMDVFTAFLKKHSRLHTLTGTLSGEVTWAFRRT
jgi:hypothetical protein